MTPAAHPTGGKCKRCGKPLTRLVLPSPIDGQLVAERWCSDTDSDCYAHELAAITKQQITASRLRHAAGGADPSRKEKDE